MQCEAYTSTLFNIYPRSTINTKFIKLDAFKEIVETKLDERVTWDRKINTGRESSSFNYLKGHCYF